MKNYLVKQVPGTCFIEVLQPQDLREKMRQMIVEMLKNY